MLLRNALTRLGELFFNENWMYEGERQQNRLVGGFTRLEVDVENSVVVIILDETFKAFDISFASRLAFKF